MLSVKRAADLPADKRPSIQVMDTNSAAFKALVTKKPRPSWAQLHKLRRRCSCAGEIGTGEMMTVRASLLAGLSAWRRSRVRPWRRPRRQDRAAQGQ
jgi:hypothetical protein